MKTEWRFFDLKKNVYSHILDCISDPEYCKFMVEKAIRIEMMTPKEYIMASANNRTRKNSYWEEVRIVDNHYVAKYAEDMMSGDKFPVPFIDRKQGDMQEGRHRAMAIEKLWKEGRIEDPKLPVVIIYEPRFSEDEYNAYGRAIHGESMWEMMEGYRKNA